MNLADLKGRPVVIGAGLAGLTAALEIAEHEPVTVVSSAPLGFEAASGWAQGGVAAAVGANDRPAFHAHDTLAAGDGLCDLDAVRRITGAAPDAIAKLARLGARFDIGQDGSLKLGLEAAHGCRRIVHANGDGTGKEILRALSIAARQCESVAILEGVDARRLLLDANGGVAGVLAAGPDGAPLTLAAARVVIATGGVAGLYAHTTNPRGAVGRGLAMAARAGATLADMEFVQFHPTALDVGGDPMPLVSEAVRGEGAILLNEGGERFMADASRAELEPRDVVSRAVWAQIVQGRRVYLDARTAVGERFAKAFPQIYAACLAAGVDPARQPIPIRPAAHYHMGGIAVDLHGRTDVEGLWACGEAASTGLHGANRLASNSLLEAAVCGAEVARDVVAHRLAAGVARSEALPAAPDPDPVRAVVERHVGVLRDRAGLEAAIGILRPLAEGSGPAADPALIGLFIAHGAVARRESRGGHARTDYPDRLVQAARTRLRLADVMDERTIADAA